MANTWLILLVVIVVIIILMVGRFTKTQTSVARTDLMIPRIDRTSLQGSPSQTHLGQTYIKQSKLIIAGLIRDGAHRVPEMMSRLESIGQQFAEYQILIVENDSIDGTRDLLHQWTQKNGRVHLLGCDNTAMQQAITDSQVCMLNLPATPDHGAGRHRIAKMAYLRNLYLEHIRKHYSSYDYLIVIDLDISGHFYLDGLTNSMYHFATSSQVEAIGANGIKWGGYWYYYDPFAYIEIGQPLEWASLEEKLNHDQEIFSQPAKTPREPIYPVTSAFGGLVIYRLSVLGSAQYDYSRTGYACEHVFFNRHFRMYLNPAMIFEIWEH
jgi:hypothetical protein